MENHVVLHFALSVFLCLSWCKQGSLSTETYQSVSPTNIEWSTRLILFFNILSVIIHQPTVLQKYRNSTDPESKKQVYKLIYCILFNSLVPAVGSATTTVPITVPFSHEKWITQSRSTSSTFIHKAVRVFLSLTWIAQRVKGGLQC